MNVEFGVGSKLIDTNFKDSTNSILGAILGDALHLSVASYEGLVGTKIRLGHLLSLLDADVSVGTLDDVLATDLTIAQLISASIAALDESQVLAVEAAEGLEQMLDLPNVDSLHVTLSDIIKLAAGADDSMNNEIKRAALVSQIALYDLVSAAIYASNKDNFIYVPELNLNTGIVGLNTGLKVTEPPQFNIGVLPADEDSEFVASAKTAQVDLYTEASILPASTPLKLDLGILGELEVALEVGTIGLKVIAAQAETKLLDAKGCSFNSEGIELDFATKPSIANVFVGSGGDPGDLSDINVEDPIKLNAGVTLKLLGATILNEEIIVNVAVSLPVESSNYIIHTVKVKPDEIPYVENGIGNGVGDSLSNGLSELKLTLTVDSEGSGILSILTDVVNLLVGSVVPLVQALISNIVLNVISPILDNVLLSKVLGIQVGTADVFVTSIEVDGGGLIE